jgi:SNF2 family DNA or RNA helicase
MLVDDPGAGKTATTLTAIDTIGLKALVVAPAFVSLTVWEKEATKWTPELKVFTLTGKSRIERIRLLAFGFDVYVINYELIKWLHDTYTNYGDGLPFFPVVVLDEIHMVKNSQGKTNKRLQYFTDKASHVWGLTGTPIGRSVEDVYGQARMIGADQRLARNVTAFRRKWFTAKNPGNFFQWEPREGAEEEIMEVLKPYMLRSELQSYESKNYAEIDVDVPLNALLMKQYRGLKKDLMTELGDRTLSVANVAVATGKLSQFTGGTVLWQPPLEQRRAGDEPIPLLVHNFKENACMELIASLQGKPVLLSYHYDHEQILLCKALSKTDLEYSTLTGVKGRRAQSIVDQFNRGEINVLLVQPQSAGHGLNLQFACHHMIIYSMASFWSQAAWVQFIGRLARPGQKHTVRVHKMLCPRTIDSVIDDVCHGRVKLNEDFMEYMK